MGDLMPLILAIAALLSSAFSANDTAEKTCVLPPNPTNGYYEANTVPNIEPTKAISINYTCNPGYELKGERVKLCYQGIWSHDENPKCLRTCNLVINQNVEYSCLLEDTAGSRPCKEVEVDGTLVEVKCKAPNYHPLGALPPMRCVNGSWDSHPICLPGDFCTDTNGIEGICVGIEYCASNSAVINQANSTICGVNSSGLRRICCPKKDTRLKTKETCKPITPRRPDMKTGKIAYHKCIEYQEQIKFPCEAVTYSPLGDRGPSVQYHRRDACSEPPPLIIGTEGIDASRGQFPHMALLGYASKEQSGFEWLCGGTIISERFILTAGHCTVHKQLGNVTIARLGILKRSDPSKVIRDYAIKRAIKHPEYKPPSKYNDIALLETEKPIVFLNKHIVPACLDVGQTTLGEEEEWQASATGWGALGEGGGNADVLQIMDITRFTDEECSQEYRPYRHLKLGLDNTTQMCYGHRQIPRDTCSGDSGGPLQVEYSEVSCMHRVIGVTSFGRACGATGRPGVYTRVRPYVLWIERAVWGEDYVFDT